MKVRLSGSSADEKLFSASLYDHGKALGADEGAQVEVGDWVVARVGGTDRGTSVAFPATAFVLTDVLKEGTEAAAVVEAKLSVVAFSSVGSSS